jgi:hypothetical protein
MNHGLSPIVRYLFFFTAIILVIFGAETFARAADNQNMKMVYMAYPILMLGDALAMLVCGSMLNRKASAVFWFAVTVLCLNIFPAIFDQFGLVDLLFVLLNAITLGLLIFYRREFLPQ